MRDDAEWLQIKIFPYDPQVDIEKCLLRLSQNKNTGKPFIHRYSTGGQRYIQVLEWHKHQKPHKYEQDSTIPRCSNVDTTSKDIASTTLSQVKGNGELKGQREVIPLDCKADLYKILKDLPLKETDSLITLFCSGQKTRSACYDLKKCHGWLKEIVDKTIKNRPENYYGYIKVSIEKFHKGEGFKTK